MHPILTRAADATRMRNDPDVAGYLYNHGGLKHFQPDCAG
jgi:hypothetical protein